VPDSSHCHTPFWLPGSHVQTLYGALLARHHAINFVRERVDTPDGDFIDFDWAGPGLFPNKSADNKSFHADAELRHTAARRWTQPQDWQNLPKNPETPAIILFHGLEGSSASHYAQAIAQYFRARGWVIVVAHFRGCSGFANRLARAYHSGDTEDLAFMLHTVVARLPQAQWHAIGISLGGNTLLRYLGTTHVQDIALTAAAAISTPLDLVACGNHLSDSFLGKQLYGRYFLRSMRRKVLDKTMRFPGLMDVLRFAHIKTLREFDDQYTAPMHGFRNALDYWTRACCLPVLPDIQTPALILNALNDPFVPKASLPTPQDVSRSIVLHQPEQGGHVGFVTGDFPGHLHWLAQRIARYFSSGL